MKTNYLVDIYLKKSAYTKPDIPPETVEKGID
jgi:hypothetical protein